MKRKDIKAGVVYAEVSAYGPPKPVVFLEDAGATIWQEPYFRRGNEPYTACSADAKPRREQHRTKGYAAVRGTVEALEGLDCAAALEAFRTRSTGPRPGLRFDLVCSLSKIPGPYAEALAAYEGRREIDRTRREERQEGARSRDARLEVVVAGLLEFSVRSRLTIPAIGGNLLGLDVDNAERLLSLLREREG